MLGNSYVYVSAARSEQATSIQPKRHLGQRLRLQPCPDAAQGGFPPAGRSNPAAGHSASAAAQEKIGKYQSSMGSEAKVPVADPGALAGNASGHRSGQMRAPSRSGSIAPLTIRLPRLSGAGVSQIVPASTVTRTPAWSQSPPAPFRGGLAHGSPFRTGQSCH